MLCQGMPDDVCVWQFHEWFVFLIVHCRLVGFSRTMSTSIKPSWKDVLQKELDGIQAAGTFKRERIITSAQNAQIRVRESSVPVLNFCANNYLGLSDHPALNQAAHKVYI